MEAHLPDWIYEILSFFITRRQNKQQLNFYKKEYAELRQQRKSHTPLLVLARNFPLGVFVQETPETSFVTLPLSYPKLTLVFEIRGRTNIDTRVL